MLLDEIALIAVRTFMYAPLFGLAMRLQSEPSQCSITVSPLLDVPTAHTSFTEIAATPYSTPLAILGAADGVHWEPFQCMMSTPVLLCPTAHTSLVDAADTP